MDFATARHNMVESQIRPNQVTDPTLIGTMLELPREAFVPGKLAGVAYVDEAIGIGAGRFLMEPMILARLLQGAEARPDDVALDIGCGTGYSAAVLSRLVGTVVAVESDGDLAHRAEEILAELGVDNVAVVEGELTAGYPDQGPYNVILIGGAVADVPETLLSQLADGGRLVTVIAKGDGLGSGVVITRFGDSISRRELFDAGTPVLPGFEPKPTFRL